MLEGLNSIDWDKLLAPYMPNFLRDLTSNDRSVQDKAWGNIGENTIPWTVLVGSRGPSDMLWLVSQDALYATIPFLIELLSYDEVTSKEFILDLLNDMARYVEADMYMPREPRNEKDLYRSNARRVYDTVSEGKSKYQELTHDPTVSVAENAAHILRELDRLSDVIHTWADSTSETN